MLMCLLEIYLELRHMRIIRMHRSMNGIKKSRALKKSHGWKMELGRNLIIVYVMNASRFNSKVDTMNGPHAIGEKKDVAIEETYQE
ncbi:hypothetical protein Tco_1487275 [Tanacetum coccineum]